ncbi:XRE family transcriptional regulator [Gordonia alkaliphila]|uniref:HTH cro/C1-type domain-containing protein n=1 Tax=Gordonia alkaliphila TaxID=1053547 RepID=A0ABP8Z631_9ACTN
MDTTTREIGERIRRAMTPGMTQRDLADQAGMTPDALSRALNGHRGFATVELIGIADLLDVDLQWLATGRHDPRQARLVARHDWDAASGRRVNGGHSIDIELLTPVLELYHQAYPAGVPSSRKLPSKATDVRERLGADFVIQFAERVEAVFEVDVVRLPSLNTAYSTMLEGERGLVALVAEVHWYRNNWSLAHELGHLALGHSAADVSEEEAQRQEAEANKFAENLLLPRELMNGVGWAAMSRSELATFLWRHGVSTKALKNRIAYLKIAVRADVLEALELSTPKLLTAYLPADPEDPHAFARREQDSAARRFPLGLLDTLTRRVAEGRVAPEQLAWALGVPVETVEPDDEALADQYFRDMAHRAPSKASVERAATQPAS